MAVNWLLIEMWGSRDPGRKDFLSVNMVFPILSGFIDLVTGHIKSS